MGRLRNAGRRRAIQIILLPQVVCTKVAGFGKKFRRQATIVRSNDFSRSTEKMAATKSNIRISESPHVSQRHSNVNSSYL